MACEEWAGEFSCDFVDVVKERQVASFCGGGEDVAERNQADVFAYIQASHFLLDNTVDIFWGDDSITCVEKDGLWQVRREEIVGTFIHQVRSRGNQLK